MVSMAVLGTIPGWLTLFGVLGLAWTLRKGMVGSAVEILQTSNEVIEKELKETKEKLREERQLSTVLEAKTDITHLTEVVLRSIDTHDAKIVLAIENHSLESAAQNQQILKGLTAIAERLEVT